MIYRPKENEVICITEAGITKHNTDGSVETIVPEETELGISAADKDGYDHFMLKEIHEQPDAIRRAASHRINSDMLPDFSTDGISEEFWHSFDSISIIACGSATHAGLVGRYVIEKLAGVPVTVNTASEYRYDPPAIVGKTLALAISQSGETADTLAGLRLAKSQGHPTAAIINAVGSAIAREADCVIYTGAGPEIAVATTKAYSAQLSTLYAFATELAFVKGKLGEEKYAALIGELLSLPDKMAKTLQNKERIQWFAARHANARDIFFIGRGLDYAICLEGSLKMKEISYIHSEAYAVGELKHGTISLVENGTLIIGALTQKDVLEKTVSNMAECRARGAYLVGLAGESCQSLEAFADFCIFVPETDPHFMGSLAIIPLQFLAYYTSVSKGLDVDKPRNLAKSVTVE